ncbi:hypothetical protein Bca4012_095935 [Brassica carinata]|uniref:Uncharacterized protein n=1 Tax=Brassica cretica TaxID=69181 RepID=A0A8S9RKX8_BRACR|nr:hypothetical protein F2Q69_00062487 [Brassica cretica]
MGLRFSLGSNESYGSRYGNVGALVLSLASAPTPPLNIAKIFSSPPTESELCSASINLTQRCFFCSIPATPVSSMRLFKRSENIEPGIPAYVVSARCHCSTLSPHPQQTNHSKLNSATHGPPGIYALMLSLIQLDEMCFCLVSVTLWLQHGNVERWSQ